MICVVVSICMYELAGQQSHSLLQVSDIKEVLLLGFYPASEMASFVTDMNKEHQQVDLTSEDVVMECLSWLQVSVRYLQEYAPLGTAGGLHHFRDQIRAGSPDAFLVMNGDVCAEFPLQEMLEFHASKDQAVRFPLPQHLGHLKLTLPFFRWLPSWALRQPGSSLLTMGVL